MHKLVFTFAILFFFGFSGQAQGTTSPVVWDFEIDKIEGNQYKVTAKATIEKKWCVYSSELDGKGPIPTSLSFKEQSTPKGGIIETSKKIERYDRMFEMKLIKYENEAIFSQVVEVESGSESVDGHVKFMTCDGSRCLPPTNVEFSLPLPQ